MQNENGCCGNCEHYRPNSNIDDTHGACKEFEALVYRTKKACGWYCKKRSESHAE